MESKFKIGDTVFFMNYSTPSKAQIKGISFVIGEVTDSVHSKREGTYENPNVEYCVGGYSKYKEEQLFTSKEALQDSLFGKL